MGGGRDDNKPIALLVFQYSADLLAISTAFWFLVFVGAFAAFLILGYRGKRGPEV
jgi:hypothetical protein